MTRNIEDIEADLKQAQEDYSYLEADDLKEFEKLRYERLMRIAKLTSERNRHWIDYERARLDRIKVEHS